MARQSRYRPGTQALDSPAAGENRIAESLAENFISFLASSCFGEIFPPYIARSEPNISDERTDTTFFPRGHYNTH